MPSHVDLHCLHVLVYRAEMIKGPVAGLATFTMIVGSLSQQHKSSQLQKKEPPQGKQQYLNTRLLACPASILYKSTASRYRPVSYPDGPITARYRIIKNANWAARDPQDQLQDLTPISAPIPMSTTKLTVFICVGPKKNQK